MPCQKLFYTIIPVLFFLLNSVSDSPALIENISRDNYTTRTLEPGVRMYNDRTFRFLSPIPAAVNFQTYLRPLNDDKNSSGTQFLSFELTDEALVYVVYDARATVLPDWLSDWQSFFHQLQSQDGERDLYYKQFPAGAVTLGGNQADGVQQEISMYNVIATPVPEPLFVDSNASGAADGETWATAFSSIQAAIEDPKSETRPIYVAEGLYEERVFMKTNRQVYGGFQVGDTLLEERDANSTNTIINDFIFASPKVAVVFPAANNSTLDGFTITSSNDESPQDGQAIFIRLSSRITISNCKIIGNEKAVEIIDSQVSITDCLFESNKFTCIYVDESEILISKVNFQLNMGTGILVKKSTGMISNCTFKDSITTAAYNIIAFRN